MLSNNSLSLALVLALSMANPAWADSADVSTNSKSSAVIQDAVREYEAGNYEKAAQLLAEDLRNNPEDGVVHYYLGIVKQKIGDDAGALDQLEWAARLCPPEMLTSLTEKTMNAKADKLPRIPRTITPKADWFGMLGNSVTQMFGPKPQPKINSEGDIEMPPPALFGSMDDIFDQGKKIVKDGVNKVKGSQYKSWAANVMPMDDMMALVDKSKSINATRWASHSDGLTKFRQAPENTPEWDAWIARFQRSFQHVLTAYLARDAKNQVTGRAACIFSVDKRGNLRGHIYASTGDSVLNSCLLKTIQALNHSRILEFPANSRVTGWNFRMTWNYGQILAHVRAYRAYQREMERRTQEEIIAKQTEALLKAKQQAEANAKAEKLKALREKQIARAKARLQELKSKSEVVGQLLTPLRPKELNAVAMSLNDPQIKKMPNVPADQKLDPFKNITDEEIMSWPVYSH